MKRFLFILFVSTSLVKGQLSCTSTYTVGDIFYPNTVSTPTSASNGYQYLCGPNTVVYDTISLGCLFVYVNTGCTLFYNKGCPQSIMGFVWLKNNSTLNILAGCPGVTVYYEPLATINNTAAIAINSVACTSITFPAINCATGINDLSNQESIFLVYPNPATNALNILCNKSIDPGSQIEIKNTLGQIVLKSSFKKEIDISTLSNGCYFIKIQSKDQAYNSKFVKE